MPSTVDENGGVRQLDVVIVGAGFGAFATLQRLVSSEEPIRQY